MRVHAIECDLPPADNMEPWVDLAVKTGQLRDEEPS